MYIQLYIVTILHLWISWLEGLLHKTNVRRTHFIYDFINIKWNISHIGHISCLLSTFPAKKNSDSNYSISFIKFIFPLNDTFFVFQKNKETWFFWETIFSFLFLFCLLFLLSLVLLLVHVSVVFFLLTETIWSWIVVDVTCGHDFVVWYILGWKHLLKFSVCKSSYSLESVLSFSTVSFTNHTSLAAHMIIKKSINADTSSGRMVLKWTSHILS